MYGMDGFVGGTITAKALGRKGGAEYYKVP